MVRQNIFEKRRGGQFIFEEDDLMEVQCMGHDAESVMNRLVVPWPDAVSPYHRNI